MRIIYLFVLVTSLHFLSSFLILNQDDNGKILWSKNVRLTEKDFRMEPPIKDSTIFARSRIEITAQSQQIENGIPIFTLKTYFVKDSSFMFIKDNNTLEHEQVHFDIAELYTRKMRRDMEQLQLKGILEIDTYLEIIRKRKKENNQLDSLFDTQCRGEIIYGKIIKNAHQVRQREWIDSITIELDKLKDYEYME